jgi:4-amino-4-deoxy-L-arabinose transferase-like glycosyltransferase
MNSSESAVAGATTRSAAVPPTTVVVEAPAGLRLRERVPIRLRVGALTRIRPELLALALLAGTLNLWDLTRNGWANAYYAAAVRSMSASWHNFLFVSFDPSGVMTVDKPPLALWVQSLSVRIFGFHPLAILAPQALMGVASVLLVYDLTARRFGRLAGFVAGLVLALTPISLAISRHNNPDALLVLCCVAALWCALRALDDGRLRWFVLTGVCVGLGFETKMLVALVVVPGIVAAWLWMRGGRAAAVPAGARRPLAAGAAMLLVGSAWPALVELTPASQRPWISGTADNTVLSLIFGYNGLGRLEGQSGGPQALGGSNLFGGSPGPLRLLNEALGGQAGWLLGFAAIGGLAILAACRLRRGDGRSGWLLIVGGAFASSAVVFSFAHGIFHPYYVSLLAPFAAALVGAGFGQLTARGARTRAAQARARAFAALALAAGVATELAVLHDYPGELRWLTPTLIVLGAGGAALLLLGGERLRRATLAGGLALLLLAPATWAVDTLGHATSGTFPAGGPAENPATGLGRGGPGDGGPGGGPGASAPGGGVAASARGGGPGVAGGGANAGAAGGGAPGASGAGTAFRGGPPGGGPPGGGSPGGVPGAGFSGAPPVGAGAAANGGLPGTGALGSSLQPAFGGTGASLTQAVRYAEAHGGGTVAVASQSEAATLVIDGAHVAGIGGFSGRESETSAAWLAQEVATGRIRWVLASTGGPGGGTGPGASTRGGTGPGRSTGGGTGTSSGIETGGPGGPRGGTGAGASTHGGPAGRDQRVGASRALSAVQRSCVSVSAVSGLYDCAGRAGALRLR